MQEKLEPTFRYKIELQTSISGWRCEGDGHPRTGCALLLYTGQEARTQMPCHVTLLLFCFRVHLFLMLVIDCAIGCWSDRSAIHKEWGWQPGRETAEKSWAFSSHPVLGRGCLTRRWKRAHDIVLNSFQIQRSSATFCTLCLGCMSLPSHSGNYSNILYHMERKRLSGSFYGPEETVWRSSQWNHQWSP